MTFVVFAAMLFIVVILYKLWSKPRDLSSPIIDASLEKILADSYKDAYHNEEDGTGGDHQGCGTMAPQQGFCANGRDGEDAKGAQDHDWKDCLRHREICTADVQN